MNKLCKPNLPICAREIIIGERYRARLETALERIGVSAIWLPDNPDVDERLAGHADLSVLHTDEGLVLAPYLKISKFADSISIEHSFADIVQSSQYPLDAALNSCIIGEKVICGGRTAYGSFPGKKLVSTNQGYARCSVCIVSEDAIITADKGIAAACKNEFDLLVIEPGYVDLDGFDYGFIGGASFKSAEDTICFTGRIDTHPDGDRILAFLSAHGVRPSFLTEEKIFDIGSAIPITEK